MHALLPPTLPCPAGMLLPVPKFSKFLHGAALLFQRSCHNVPYRFLPGQQRSAGLAPSRLVLLVDRMLTVHVPKYPALLTHRAPVLLCLLCLLQMSGTPPS